MKKNTVPEKLKLDYRRTCLIGFAFFGILLLWQVYDTWCPTFLTDIFAYRMYGMTTAELNAGETDRMLSVQWLVGIIMACDNVAALILLPVFGRLSDRTHTRIGKRMPYILIGTFVSAVAFPFIPLLFHEGKTVGMILMMALVLISMMMYRDPAVALMPDLTPKPLRAKANGLINMMGALGGAFATVMGLWLVLSDYINTGREERDLWIIELPFIIASVLMVISALVLFFTVRENELTEQLREEMELGERLAAVESPVAENGPMSRANRTMLLSILAAEFFWFMADNAVGTYINNYVIYYLGAVSSLTSVLIIVGGAAGLTGLLLGGGLADRIGRKWTVCAGLAVTLAGYALMCFIRPEGDGSFPKAMYVLAVCRGFGMALVHNCAFPMVVELCSSGQVGRFTGYYYVSSMAAQTVTPILLGQLFRVTMAWKALPVYALVLTAIACAVFTVRVRNIRSGRIRSPRGLEALSEAD